MTAADALPASALRRRAAGCVRQSSQPQARTTLESKRRQRGLVEVARQHGCYGVEAIGGDRLAAWLCAGDVGAVPRFDASRLARNGRGWRRLLELCGLAEARTNDTQGVYDPCRPNDLRAVRHEGRHQPVRAGGYARPHPGAVRLRPALQLAHAVNAEALLEHAPDLNLQFGVALDASGQAGRIGTPHARGKSTGRSAAPCRSARPRKPRDERQ